MPIVKQEKRETTIRLLADMRAQIRNVLAQADSLQATCETLELELGLANEGEQSARDQLLVLHYGKGDETGHPLEDCSDDCVTMDVLEDLGEGSEDKEVG